MIPKETRHENHYKNLSEHIFTSEEKGLFIDFIRQNDIPVRTACRRYDLNRSTVKTWKTVLENNHYLHSAKGRPASINAAASENIKDFIINRREANNAVKKRELDKSILEGIRTTSESVNRINHDVCAKTLKKIKDNVGTVKVTPQVITPARIKACNDVSMCYTTWIMAKSCLENMPSQLIWNWDATQFVVGGGEAESEVYVIKNGDKSPVSITGNESLSIGVKWMHMGSAAGETVPTVLLVAVDELKATDFYVVKIPGLASTANVGTFGYLCFCKTRVGNSAFFQWFINNIAIETVESSRRHHECIVSTLFII